MYCPLTLAWMIVLKGIECVCVILKFWIVATNLREIKSCPYGKRFQRITILIVLNKLHPYIWFFSISASLDQVTSENDTLKHATKHGCPELGNQGYAQLSYSFSIQQTSNLATGMILFKTVAYIFCGPNFF